MNLDLRGKSVRLRSVTAGDRDRLVAIRGTEEVRRRWRGETLDTEFDVDLLDDHLHQLVIETLNGGVIGMIQFEEEQDPDYRSASLDIYVDPASHRRGYATDAIRTLVNYLFDDLDHHRLTIDPAANNTAAIACYSKVGFRPVGTMRAHERQSDGSWADALLMDMLPSDRRSN
jgi:aminoglycoside 6'-N-acetyltransferase